VWKRRRVGARLGLEIEEKEKEEEEELMEMKLL